MDFDTQVKLAIYTHHGHKLRFSQSKKTQFPGTVRQDRCVTGGIIQSLCRDGARPIARRSGEAYGFGC